MSDNCLSSLVHNFKSTYKQCAAAFATITFCAVGYVILKGVLDGNLDQRLASLADWLLWTVLIVLYIAIYTLWLLIGSIRSRK
jgi:hypothetical protein